MASGGLGLLRVGKRVSLGQVVLLIQKIEKGPQLQPGDIRPTTAEFHVLKQAKECASFRGKAGSKSPILDRAMEMFQLAEQGKQGEGIFGMDLGDSVDALEKRSQLCLKF